MVAIRRWLAFAFCLVVPVAAHAQAPDTRAAEIAAAQAEKAGQVKPYQRNAFERRLFAIEEAGGFAVQRGFFVTFGDIKQGSSIAIGPAYAKLFDNGARIVAKGTYSIRNFKLVQVAVEAPRMAGGRLTVHGRARWQDAPLLAAYALGPNSSKDRADFSETKTEISGQAEIRPVRVVRLGGGIGWERYEIGGADSTRASIEEMFTPLTMPGIQADPEYVHSFVSAGIDTRRGLGYSRSGSLLHATLHDYRQQNDTPQLSITPVRDFSFQRVDAIARQLIPILRGNWVIDLSVRTSTTTTDAGSEVPFFLMPDLGGSGELRGYSAYRFRDRNSIIFTGEYRWYVQEYVDMALFYDAGKVARRSGDLDFDNLESNVGVGIRFHGPQTTVLRIEVAKGNEGLRFIFGFSAPVK